MAFGVKEAQHVQGMLNKVAPDVQLFFDDQVQPHGIWVMCQVMKRSSSLILPSSYMQDGIKPYIMWYIKDVEGRARVPNERDVMDVIATRQRAEKIWEKGGDYLADKLDEQDAEKDARHRQKLKDKVHEIAPDMKKAIRKELL